MRSPVERFRQRQHRTTLAVKGMVRRVTISATSNGFWQLLGFDDETLADVPTFSNIGFWSRPKAGNPSEAIVAFVGGNPDHPVVIASRDRSVQVAIDDDETVIFNSTGALVKIKNDGTVELGGTDLGSTDGVVHGSGIDSLTGISYALLGNTSSVVRAKK